MFYSNSTNNEHPQINKQEQTCKIGLGRLQQKYSTERIALVPFSPHTNPTNRLQLKKKKNRNKITTANQNLRKEKKAGVVVRTEGNRRRQK